MPVIHKPAMRKVSFKGAAAVMCDQPIWSLKWTQVRYVCARAEWENQLTLCYNAVLFEGSSLQGCYGMSTDNIDYRYFEETYYLYLVGQHHVISVKTCVSISSALRISNLALNTSHQENPTRCNSVSKFLFHIYMKLNMSWAAHRPSSGA